MIEFAELFLSTAFIYNTLLRPQTIPVACTIEGTGLCQKHYKTVNSERNKHNRNKALQKDYVYCVTSNLLLAQY